MCLTRAYVSLGVFHPAPPSLLAQSGASSCVQLSGDLAIILPSLLLP